MQSPPIFPFAQLPPDQAEALSEGLSLIARSCARRTKYTIKASSLDEYLANPTFLSRSNFPKSMTPFLDGKDCYEFIGDPGISASIGAFIFRIMSSFEEDHARPKLRFHLFKTREIPAQHMIAAQYSDNYETLMCAGMTDHSGEGGAAYADMRKVFTCLSFICQVPVLFVEHSAEAWDAFSSVIYLLSYGGEL